MKFIKSGKDLQQEGLELVVRRRKSKSAEIFSLLQAQFPSFSQPMLPSNGTRHLQTVPPTDTRPRSVSRSSINQTPSVLAPKSEFEIFSCLTS